MQEYFSESLEEKAEQIRKEEYKKILREAVEELEDLEKEAHPLGFEFDTLSVTISVPPSVSLQFKKIK